MEHGTSVSVIAGVTPGSAAAEAGLTGGMTILAIDEQPGDGAERFFALVSATRPGEDEALQVRTDTGERRVVR